MAARASDSRPPCPTAGCPAPHVVRNGTLAGGQRYHCRGCKAWFGQTRGTPLYRLRTPPAEIGPALLIVMRRGSLRAAEEISGHKYETIGEWLRRAGDHAEELTQVLVKDLELDEVEVDAFWSFVGNASRALRRGQVRHRQWASAWTARAGGA